MYKVSKSDILNAAEQLLTVTCSSADYGDIKSYTETANGLKFECRIFNTRLLYFEIDHVYSSEDFLITYGDYHFTVEPKN